MISKRHASSRGKVHFARLLPALLVVMSSSLTRDAFADPPESGEDADRPFDNPFSDTYERGPGWLRTGVHMGTMHRDGIGPRVWFIPWDYVQLSASYGYWTEHSFWGGVSAVAFPHAGITPYVTGGYALAITKLPYGLRMTTHQIVTGLGLEARVHDRYFLAAEATLNTAWSATLKNKEETLELTPGERYTVQSGFYFGVTLL